jgi:hypothetical protein
MTMKCCLVQYKRACMCHAYSTNYYETFVGLHYVQFSCFPIYVHRCVVYYTGILWASTRLREVAIRFWNPNGWFLWKIFPKLVSQVDDTYVSLAIVVESVNFEIKSMYLASIPLWNQTVSPAPFQTPYRGFGCRINEGEGAGKHATKRTHKSRGQSHFGERKFSQLPLTACTCV